MKKSSLSSVRIFSASLKGVTRRPFEIKQIKTKFLIIRFDCVCVCVCVEFGIENDFLHFWDSIESLLQRHPTSKNSS
jgi:hypothetical protein